MLGAGPADEDQILVQQYIQGVQQFDFFGLGQQIEAPNHNHQLLGINDAAPDQQEQEQENACPNGLRRLQPYKYPVHPVFPQEINLNVAPLVLAQDLNEAPMNEDPQEVLIHPGPMEAQQHTEIVISIHQPIQPEPQPAQEQLVLIEEVA